MEQTKGTSTKRKADGRSSSLASKLRSIKSGQSRPDTERDSGFSDENYERSNTEDSNRSVVQKGPPASQLAVVGSPYSSISPVIIMNNVLLKQPGDDPSALKPWGVQPVVPQPQVVFLQPVVSPRSSSSSSSKETTTTSLHPRRRRPKKYLPILKSYPKIAPYPGDGSSSSGRGTASSSSSASSPSSCSRSSLSGSPRGSALASGHWGRCRRDEQKSSLTGGTPVAPPAASSASPLLPRRHTLPSTDGLAASASQSLSAPGNSASSTATPAPPPCGDGGAATAPESNRRRVTSDCNRGDGGGDPEHKSKRFRNTYDILSRSGLLDITLRTKELLRQNRRTQAELEHLREHAAVFVRALQSGDWSLCLELQASLQPAETPGGKREPPGAQTSSKAD